MLWSTLFLFLSIFFQFRILCSGIEKLSTDFQSNFQKAVEFSYGWQYTNFEYSIAFTNQEFFTTNTSKHFYTENSSLQWKLNTTKDTGYVFIRSPERIEVNENGYIILCNYVKSESGECSTSTKLHFFDKNGTSIIFYNIGSFLSSSTKIGADGGEWIRTASMYSPSSLGSGSGFIPKGAAFARIEYVANYHTSADCECYVDNFEIFVFDQKPSIYEQNGIKDLTQKEFEYSLTFEDREDTRENENFIWFKNRMTLGAHMPQSYSTSSSIYENEEFIQTVSDLKFEFMRIQLARFIVSQSSGICPVWDIEKNTCAPSFEHLVVSNNYEGNKTVAYLEKSDFLLNGTSTVFIYSDGTSDLAFSYLTNDYIEISPEKFYEVGFYYYLLEGKRGFDVSIYFYDSNKVFIERIWPLDTLVKGGSSLDLNKWIRISGLFRPMTEDMQEEDTPTGYIPKNAKFAKVKIYINYHSIRKTRCYDGFNFLHEFEGELPTEEDRENRIKDDFSMGSNLVLNGFSDLFSQISYNFEAYDNMFNFIHKVGAEPWLQYPIGNWTGQNYLPENFPIDDSYGFFYHDSYGYFANSTIFKEFLRKNLEYVKKDVRLLGVGNEAVFSSFSDEETMHKHYSRYMGLYEAFGEVLDEIKDHNFKLSCDRSEYVTFMKEYLKKAKHKIGFLNIHHYEIGGYCFYPSNITNINNTFYLPNDQNGYNSEELILSSIEDTTTSKSFSAPDLRTYWKEEMNEELELYIGELNMNSYWRNGSDFRMPGLFGGIWTASKLIWYMETESADNVNYFTLFNFLPKTRNSENYKHGAIGFTSIAIDNYDDNGELMKEPKIIKLPAYWVMYFISNYFEVNRTMYSHVGENEEALPFNPIDILVNIEEKNILIVNKLNESIKLTLKIDKKIDFEKSRALILDQNSFIRYYNEESERLIFERSDVTNVTLSSVLIDENTKEESISIAFDGYSVVVLDLKEEEDEYSTGGSLVGFLISFAILIPILFIIITIIIVVFVIIFFVLKKKKKNSKDTELEDTKQ